MAGKAIPFSGAMVRAIIAGRKSQTRRVLTLPTKGEYVRPDMGGWEPTTVGGKGVYCRDGTPAPEQVAIWNRTTGTCVVAPFQVGERRYITEAWRVPASLDKYSGTQIAEKALDAGYRRPWCPIKYEADDAYNSVRDWNDFGDGHGAPKPGRYRQARFMPRWASRLTITVTDARVQQLQDISEEDAIAEGVEPLHHGWFPYGISTFMTTVINGREVPAQCCRTARDSYRLLWDFINGAGSWDANPWITAATFNLEERNIDEVGR